MLPPDHILNDDDDDDDEDDDDADIPTWVLSKMRALSGHPRNIRNTSRRSNDLLGPAFPRNQPANPFSYRNPMFNMGGFSRNGSRHSRRQAASMQLLQQMVEEEDDAPSTSRAARGQANARDDDLNSGANRTNGSSRRGEEDDL